LIFAPNTAISKSTATLLITVQAGFLLLLWIFSPFVFFPSASETLQAFISLWNAGLVTDLVTSLTLNLEAIGVATTISLLIAYSYTIPFCRPLVSFISKLRFLSLVGLTFFFTLATKDGHMLKLDLLAFSIIVFFVTSMVDVIANIPQKELDLARTLRMKPWRVVFEVVVLGQADKAFDVLRQNSAIGWMALTMVEGMSRSEGGIGALLMTQNKHFHLSSVLAIQLTIMLLGLAQDYGIGVMRNMFCPYANLKKVS